MQGSPRDRWIAAALLVVCFVVYHLAPVHQLYDWRYITTVSHSLLHDGDLTIDPSLAERSRYQIHEVDGRYYHFFPNAPAVLNLPFVWLYGRLGAPIFDGDGRFQIGSEVGALRSAAAFATAAAVAVLYLVARLYLPTGWALGLTLVFAFGSPLLSSASRPFWSHCWGVLLLALGLYWSLAPSRGRGLLMGAAAATAVSWAVFTRPPFALSALALTAVIAARPERRRSLPWFLTVGAFWLALFFLYSWWVYGEAVPPYFYSSTVSEGRLTGGRLLGFHPEAAVGTLVSPAHGLFFFTPYLLAILLAVLRYWRSLTDRVVAVAAVGVFVAHWHLISSFENWSGGASFGPRLFTDVLPWFFVLGAIGLQTMRLRDGGRPAAGRRLARWLPIALLVGASLFIHARGATARATIRHFGTWNWRTPPFLVGLVPVAGAPLPGMLLRYDAGADVDPSDGWQNLTRRRGFDLELHESVTHAARQGARPGISGAFVFAGAGGGTMPSLQELGGRPDVTERPATIEIWFRPVAGEGRQVLFETGGGDRGVTLFVDRRRVGLEVRSSGRRGSARLEAPSPVGGGRFTQLVAVLDPQSTGTELSLYVDGERVAGPLLAEQIDDWAGGNRTGVATDDAHPSLRAGDFIGEIAIVQFYSSALGPKQVAHNYRAVAVSS